VLFTSAEESFGAAAQELRAVFGPRLPIERAGPDAGVVDPAGPPVDAIAAACRAGELVFLRHLTVVHARLPLAGTSPAEVAGAAVELAGTGDDLAVQAWVSGSPQAGFRAGELAQAVTHELTARGVRVRRAGCPQVLSLCVTPGAVLLGRNAVADSLADWPGGRIRLARDSGQISRAEFKLEELFQIFPVDLPAGGTALDLGAAPGGWTRILRRCGLHVWAVDPGDLHPSLLRDRRVVHERTTAGEFLRGTRERFDVVVNDMRMDPVRSCAVLLDAARRMRRGGLAIVTLKTGTRGAVETVDRCRATLDRAFDLLFARQLHHNRHELTVVARLRA
jgi:23S rRNA (cytidine2498-2'-O)-methyltransferase